MDNLSYNYTRDVNGYLINNKLGYIGDQVAATAYQQDLDNQSAGNYAYDNIGNIIGDQASNIQSNQPIHWTVYGKISSIQQGGLQQESFGYDPAGKRITKVATASNGKA